VEVSTVGGRAVCPLDDGLSPLRGQVRRRHAHIAVLGAACRDDM